MRLEQLRIEEVNLKIKSKKIFQVSCLNQQLISNMRKTTKLFYIILITSSLFKNSLSYFKYSNESFPLNESDSFMENDLSFLSELPLEKLLKVKKSINELKHAKFKAANDENEFIESKESRISNDDNLNFSDHNLRRDALTSNNEIKLIR